MRPRRSRGTAQSLWVRRCLHLHDLPRRAISLLSLLLTKINSEHQLQLFRYWPETGKLRSFSVVPNIFGAGLAVVPGGRQTVVIGRRIGPGDDSTVHLMVLNLESGDLHTLPALIGHG